MICVDARHLIHLEVGDDLKSDQERLLATHMESCGECRAYHAGMSQAMGALHVLRDSADEDSADGYGTASVWPAVSRVIQQKNTARAAERKPQTRQFNTRVAALAVCSLAMAVVTIVQNLPVSRQRQTSGYAPAHSASNGSMSVWNAERPIGQWSADDQQPAGWRPLPGQTMGDDAMNLQPAFFVPALSEQSWDSSEIRGEIDGGHTFPQSPGAF